MFDKQSQRQRAINQTLALLQHGHQPPINPIPPIPVVPTGPKDMQGKLFEKGQKIVRPVKVGNAICLKVCWVTHVAGNQVYADNSMRGLGHPERALILKDAL